LKKVQAMTVESPMLIRDAQPSDGPAVRRVVFSAFGQGDEARLVAELTRAGDAIVSLVAEDDGELIGHVLLSRMSAPFPSLALAPVSVVPQAQGKGVGSSLVRAAIDRASVDGWRAVFVLGDPGYYERFGFAAEAARGFSTPYAGEHFMALALSGDLACLAGELKHAPAFAALG
jgi:putative acetyltransferase